MNQQHQADDNFEGGDQGREATGQREPTSQASGTQQETREANLPSRAAVVHQHLRLEGQKELSRDSMALLWSAIAAGISMSFSMVARGVLHAHLPQTDIGFLVECLGYTVGFIVVILARQQLFTENTVTAVLPVMSRPTLPNLGALGRLWGVVLVGNLMGAALSSFTFLHMPMFDEATHQAFIALGEHMMANTPMEMFSKGILAGWMIATLVWLIPAADTAKVWMIVGTSEALYLVFDGHITWSDAVVGFALPTLAGNVIGGTFIFALISHAQIRGDVEAQRECKQGLFNRRQR